MDATDGTRIGCKVSLEASTTDSGPHLPASAPLEVLEAAWPRFSLSQGSLQIRHGPYEFSFGHEPATALEESCAHLYRLPPEL